MVATAGVNAAFLLDATTFFISAALLSRIHFPRSQREEGEGFVRELRAGFGYLIGARVALGIVAGAFLATLATNATIPADVFLAKETFGTGDTGYGLVISATGFGRIAGTAFVAVLGSKVRPLSLYFVSLFIVALSLAGTGISPIFVLALLAVWVQGFANAVSNVTEDTVLQERVPDSFLGRVFSVHFLAYNTGDALGLVAGGLVVDAIGPRLAYVLAGGATTVVGLLVLVVISAARDKELRR
jgi:MFS family permease